MSNRITLADLPEDAQRKVMQRLANESAGQECSECGDRDVEGEARIGGVNEPD